MASSEGVTFRWEAFNRWCDEYADANGGMKPKVEDVRKWHRDYAEKVWPDSSERPSVFLAVSHNKGRRVRGHKTCEYYKRYRAGKAAEQQLAARLQPAALSGRRILAVTAAARKINTDCARGLVKRSPVDVIAALGAEHTEEGDGELPELGHADKRRRMRSTADVALSDRRPSRPAGSLRRSSSDGISEDPSWASGAETSHDDEERDGDSGYGLAVAVPAHASARRCGPFPSYPHPLASNPRVLVHGPRTGVHITVLRRDSDGRTVQVETQPARGGGVRHEHEHDVSQALYPHYEVGGVSSPDAGLAVPGIGSRQQPCRARDVGDKGSKCRSRGRVASSRRPAASRGHFDGPGRGRGCNKLSVGGSGGESDDDGVLVEGGDQSRRRAYGKSSADDVRGGVPPEERQQEAAAGGDCGVTAEGWAWEGLLTVGNHPGVAPQSCRRTRRSSEPEQGQRRLPRFCRYVRTPLGTVPVYSLSNDDASGGGGEGDDTVRRTHRVSGRRSEGDVGAGLCEARDPLDLLAEAACDALASPRSAPKDEEDGFGDAVPGCIGAGGASEPAACAAAVAGVALEGAAGCGGNGGVPAECSDGDGGTDLVPVSDLHIHGKPAGPVLACVVKGACDGGKGAAASSGCASPIGHGGLAAQRQLQLQGLAMAAFGPEPFTVKPERVGGVEQHRGTSRPPSSPASCRGCCTAVGLADAKQSVASALPERVSATATDGDGSGAVPAGSGSRSGLGYVCGAEQMQSRARSTKRRTSSSSADSAGAQSALAPLPKQPPLSGRIKAEAQEVENANGLAAAAMAATGDDDAGKGTGEAARQSRSSQQHLSRGGSGDATTAAAATCAAAASCADSGFGGPCCQLALLAPDLEAKLTNRAPANVAAANIATVLLQGQPAAALPLNAAAGGPDLALGPLGALPPALPTLSALSLPGAVTPPTGPPLLWPALAGGMGSMLVGAPALAAAAATAPLFADASLLGSALAGAGAAGGAGGQLLPMMRLLQMQMAGRGLDPNSCHE